MWISNNICMFCWRCKNGRQTDVKMSVDVLFRRSRLCTPVTWLGVYSFTFTILSYFLYSTLTVWCYSHVTYVSHYIFLNCFLSQPFDFSSYSRKVCGPLWLHVDTSVQRSTWMWTSAWQLLALHCSRERRSYRRLSTSSRETCSFWEPQQWKTSMETLSRTFLLKTMHI